jgi:hypothetical protein
MLTKLNTKPIGLTELIYQIKRELLSPEIEQRDPIPLFAVEEIEVEATILVKREAEGGIDIQVLSLKGSGSQEAGQTVRVTLKPLLSREQLISKLQKEAPELFEQVEQEALHTLRGGQERPMSWPA